MKKKNLGCLDPVDQSGYVFADVQKISYGLKIGNVVCFIAS